MTTASRRLDPTGKRALFEAPVSAAPDRLRSGTSPSGRSALFSTGGPERGTVLVTCSRCRVKSRVSLGDIAMRIAAFSVYLPLVRPAHPHRITCPACERGSWCHIGWQD